MSVPLHDRIANLIQRIEASLPPVEDAVTESLDDRAEMERIEAPLRALVEAVEAAHRAIVARIVPPVAMPLAEDDALTEYGLRKMMRDPRYWRLREPEYVARVTEGFRRLMEDQA